MNQQTTPRTGNPIVTGIDAGGTMADTILVDPQGRFTIGKAATTPLDEAEGFIASAQDAADAWGITLDALFGGVDVVLYSGTGMLNTLLSRIGRRLGLITTKGLEDMILMGRGLQAWSDYSYADRLHAVTHAHPDPLVPRRCTHSVTERTKQDTYACIVYGLTYPMSNIKKTENTNQPCKKIKHPNNPGIINPKIVECK